MVLKKPNEFTEPNTEKSINGFIFTWPDYGLIIKTSRLDVHTDGRITGELFITNNNLDDPAILLSPTLFNFSSEPTRLKYAKNMQLKLDLPNISWPAIFDYLGTKVQELARTGAESEEIWAGDEIPQLSYILEPIIINGQSNIIFGEKGVSKSTLAYMAGAIINLPWEDNPLELMPGPSRMSSLVLDWETDRATFDYYLTRLKLGNDMPAFSLHYRRCTMPLSEDIEEIEGLIKTKNIGLLIIDSLAAAAGGEDAELKGSQSALKFNTAIRKLNTTSLIIAQTSKQQANQQRVKKTIYGSTIFTYYARNIFELCHAEDESDIKHLALFHRECNLDRKSRPMGFRMEYREDRSIVISREPVSISEFAEKLNTQSRVLEILQRGAMFDRDISGTLEITLNNSRVALNRLLKRGKIVKLDKNKYGLSYI